MTQVQHTNRLIDEKSPYLLQHAHNPVDWYPWGDEAFARAAAEDKPIFLSIGYSTCHWCHVMERESFEDPQAAALLNEGFVSIKVDREERPDIDDVYMAVCQAVTGGGGWPLTIIMTPEKQPFFAGTYIPAESRFGQMGLREVLPRLVDFWRDQRVEALELATRIQQALSEPRPATRPTEPSEGILRQAFEQLLARYDSVRGGFGRAPKFPTPHNFGLLLRHWQRTRDPRALQMVEHTLQAIRRGGITDQVGLGLHRYSTDPQWLVPHFEKMLYDQALLALACLETYQATRDPQYADIAREIFVYVLRDMTSPEGGFYSAEDADSEGVEGKFYVWTEAELRDTLPPDLADLVVQVYDVKPGGNFEDEVAGEVVGTNILHLEEPLEKSAERLGLSPQSLRESLERARVLLLAHRDQRIRPLRDDKILTDWNGLMIAAFARAAWTLDEPVYLDAASKAADFILDKLRDDQGRLLHRFREGQAAILGFLDDYTFLTWGLLELYQADFQPQRLLQARFLTDHAVEHFLNRETGAFAFSAAYHEQLLVQREQAYDGAVPSGNSAMLLNLLRLSRLLGMPQYEERAGELARAFAAEVSEVPSAHTQFLVGLDMALSPGREVLICGGTEAERAALLAPLRLEFLPHTVIMMLHEEVHQELVELAPWLETYPADQQPAAAYVCTGRTCQPPVTLPQELVGQLFDQARGVTPQA